MGRGGDASRSNVVLDSVAFGPNVGLGVNASRSNMELDTVVFEPNMWLGVEVPYPTQS